jgi:hypothetical protein
VALDFGAGNGMVGEGLSDVPEQGILDQREPPCTRPKPERDGNVPAA